MGLEATAIEILARAESELRRLIERALSEGRYVELAAIARLADGLTRLARSSATVEEPPPAALPLKQGPQPTRQPHHLREAGTVAASRRSYPRFAREGDRLVKIAWSKRDKAEYEHRAPQHVVALLLDAIRRLKGEGARFTAPDILPLQDPKTRGEIPSYQVYLALAWLRSEGVIVKFGRDSYSLRPTVANQERLTELWQALPSRA